MLREVEVLKRLTEQPAKPYVVILGGSKVSDKLAVIDALLPKVDRLLIGGGMCFTFLAAQGSRRRWLAAGRADDRDLRPAAGAAPPAGSCCRPTWSSPPRCRLMRKATVVAADAIPAG